GRALLCGPELLLMDEPLAGLDEALKDRLLTYLERALAEWRMPALFVSHDQDDVRRLAAHVVVIQSGRLVAGPIDRALPSLDGVPVNLLRVTDLREVAGTWEGRVGGQLLRLPPAALQAGGSALVRVQPQDVTLTGRTADPGVSGVTRIDGVVREILLVRS